MNIKKILSCFILLTTFFMLISCKNNTKPIDTTNITEEEYTITWKNYDGTILETNKDVKKGTMPTYSGISPTKDSTEKYTYTFAGWDPQITSVSSDITYTATYTESIRKYNVTFVDDDGTVLKETTEYEYGTEAINIMKPEDPTKESTIAKDYMFLGWTPVIKDVKEDVTYKAVYAEDYKKYNVTFVDEDGETILKEATEYEYGTEAINIVKPENPTKESDNTYTYSFIGWDPIVSSVCGDITYKAVYQKKYINYTISFVNNGEIIQTNTYHYGEPVSAPSNPKKPHDKTYTYEFSSWDSEVVDCSGNKVYTAQYTKTYIEYKVNLFSSNNLACNGLEGAGTYHYAQEVIINARTNEGYVFKGWYEGETKVWDAGSVIFHMPDENIEYEARWYLDECTIKINNSDNRVTISGITSGNEYDFGTKITLVATNVPKGGIVSWNRSDEVTYIGDTYSFIVPSIHKLTINVVMKPYIKDESKIYFGRYPQTLVEATTDNGLSSITFDSSSWTSYKYYQIGGRIEDYMYYLDLDIDNDGILDYRGVYFTKYRPYSVLVTDSYQDNNNYETNTIYWFRYDLIEWNILKEENGKAFILANLALDSQEFYPSNSNEEFEHNGGTGYANNYELSSIRRWLNENFYNTAFQELQKGIILTTALDTNVEDKLFLLSDEEVTEFYETYEERRLTGTDYAKVQGLKVQSSDNVCDWILRTPYTSNAYDIKCVTSYGNISYWTVANTSKGIRPACWIIL